MAARSSPGGFVVATVTNPGSFMATITHPTGNGYCRCHRIKINVAGINSHVRQNILGNTVATTDCPKMAAG